MKRRISLFITVALLLILAAACAGSGASKSAVPQEAPQARPPMNESMAEEASFDQYAGSGEVTTSQSTAEQQRLIIRTGWISIVATDTEQAMDAIADMANKSGGWVVSSEVYQYGSSAKRGTIQIRIPAAGFQNALDAIAGLAVDVTSVSTSGQDVTEEYVDLDARLGNMEATAARLRKFLDEADNVEDALAVNMELSRVEGEIEAMKGRMKYLEQSSAFSSISVDVTPDIVAQPIQAAKWQPVGEVKGAIEALINAFQTVISAAIWLVIAVLPVFLVVVVLPLALFVWIIRRLRARKQASHPKADAGADEPAATPPSEK